MKNTNGNRSWKPTALFIIKEGNEIEDENEKEEDEKLALAETERNKQKKAAEELQRKKQLMMAVKFPGRQFVLNLLAQQPNDISQHYNNKLSIVKCQPPKQPGRKASWGFIITGILLVIAGAVMTPCFGAGSLPFAVGIGMLACGVSMIGCGAAVRCLDDDSYDRRLNNYMTSYSFDESDPGSSDERIFYLKNSNKKLGIKVTNGFAVILKKLSTGDSYAVSKPMSLKAAMLQMEHEKKKLRTMSQKSELKPIQYSTQCVPELLAETQSTEYPPATVDPTVSHAPRMMR